MQDTKKARMKSVFKALREILIIVSSILLAFLLDAWWDLRQERESVNLLLSDLTVEYEGVVSDLHRYINRNNQLINAADSILIRVRFGTDPASVSAAHLGALLRTPTMNPRLRNLEALVASGRLDLVQPDSLRALLAVWPSALDDVQENEIASWNFVHEAMLPDLGAFVDLADPMRWRLNELKDWRGEELDAEAGAQDGGELTVSVLPGLEVVNLVQTRRYLAEIANGNYRDLLKHAEDIKQQLETLGRTQ